MDFKRELPLPFYLGYDGSLLEQVDTEYEQVRRDFAYLQTVCPTKIKEYQKRIEKMLDTMDYEGSMIYDEFPDQFSLSYLAKMLTRGLAEGEEELPDVKEMMEVLVCNEIFKRRLQAGRKKYYGIQTGIGGIFGREVKDYHPQ